MAETFQLIVIGGGTAGLRCSLYAANHGIKTLLVEPAALGGTCLNTGCIPTKAMLHASHLYASRTSWKEYGIDGTVKLNFPQLMKRVRSIVQSGQTHIGGSMERAKNLTRVNGRAGFTGKNSIEVNGETYRGKKIIVCTGAKAFIPPIPGLKDIQYLCHYDIINLKKLPKSIIMIGGGYIALEFATFFNQLGVKVHVLERMPHILGMLSEEVSTFLMRLFQRQGIVLHTGANIIKVSGTKAKKKVIFNELANPNSPKQEITADAILVATGRVPNTDGLNLKAAGIKMNTRGAISVNGQCQTSNKNVYAVGDVNGATMFAHAAKRESQVVLDQIVHKKKSTMDFSLVPRTMFTTPPVSGVGISQKVADQKKLKYGMMKAHFQRAGRATIIGQTQGFMKVLYEKRSKKILGTTIIGPHSDDIVHEFVAVMNSKSPTIDVIKKTIHVHPTLSEVIDALREVPVGE